MTAGAAIARLNVRNLIRQAFDGRRRERPLEVLTTAAWHRLSFAEDEPTQDWPDVQPVPDEQLDGLVVAARFADARRRVYTTPAGAEAWYGRSGAYTGGETPYHLLVCTDGSVDQLVELGDTAIHARRWNAEAIGVAVAGDFRRRPLTAPQRDTCVTLAALFHAWGLLQKGHTELGAGATSDPDKVCPGAYFSMDWLRQAADDHELGLLAPFAAEALLAELGVVF